MTRTIALTNGDEAIVDSDDYDFLMRAKWHKCKDGYAYSDLYIQNKNGPTFIYMHRLILLSVSGLQIDHINRCRLDNRKSNLRPATTSEQMQNRTKTTGTSAFRGVSKKTNGVRRFQATITKHRTRIYLGVFFTEEEAARAYDREALKLYGPNAAVNFPATRTT